MEIFWTERIEAGLCLLGEEESAHCVRVLRHREGDNVCVIDGAGTMYECVLSQASPKAAVARIEKANPGWGSHPYRLEMAVCPTKNIDRYEWFVEKATEVGADRSSPVIGEHSERKVLKTERLRRIVLSAAKQSLKAAVPEIAEPLTVKDFITSVADTSALKMIACCFEDESHPRTSVMQALSGTDKREYIVLIGPEGDFSREEVRLATEAGFIPVHLGESRLRTETAALAAVLAAYYNNI